MNITISGLIDGILRTENFDILPTVKEEDDLIRCVEMVGGVATVDASNEYASFTVHNNYYFALVNRLLEMEAGLLAAINEGYDETY